MTRKSIEELRDRYANPENATAELLRADTEGATTVVQAADGQPQAERMSNYSVRVPADVLKAAGEIAAAQGMTTGAWLRQSIEAAVAQHEAGDLTVSVPELLAFIAEHGYPKAS
ncbi:MAG: hypothetical protein J2P18_18750 [Nocardia sp.]|nr:hypothetical protein [Nocardia sp.]